MKNVKIEVKNFSSKVSSNKVDLKKKEYSINRVDEVNTSSKKYNEGSQKKTNRNKFTFRFMKVSKLRVFLYFILLLLTCGLIEIYFFYDSLFRDRFFLTDCSNSEATYIRFQKVKSTRIIIDYIKLEHFNLPVVGRFFCFSVQGVRYLAKESEQWAIEEIPASPAFFTPSYVTREDTDLQLSRDFLFALYGINKVISKKSSLLTLILQDILSPFYIFQYFAVAIWLWTEYYEFSSIVMFITIASVSYSVYMKKYNEERLDALTGTHNTVELTNHPLVKATKQEPEVVSDINLLPGDCFTLREGMELNADVIILSGRVLVDESMLTGESAPVTKTSFPLVSKSDALKSTSNIVFSGSKIINLSSDKVICIVFRTGAYSSRGKLINELITTRIKVVQFLPDALLSILFLIGITSLIYIWSAMELIRFKVTLVDYLNTYLTALTIAVPPGLVACLSIGISLAVARLHLKNISITDNSKIISIGSITCACFDKTGTLTNNNIDLKGMKVYKGRMISTDPFYDKLADTLQATCHTLTCVDNVPMGDPLEEELFKKSRWELKVQNNGKDIYVYPPLQAKSLSPMNPYKIVRQFEFSADKLRSGSLVLFPPNEFNETELKIRDEVTDFNEMNFNKGKIDTFKASNIDISPKKQKQNQIGQKSFTPVYFVKGSPEKIISICNPSTIPHTIDKDLKDLAKMGYRIIGIAYNAFVDKSVSELINTDQEDLEHNLTFLGLIFFSNQLKEDTVETIQSLNDAHISVHMITGDHDLTATAIAAQCNLIPSTAPKIFISSIECTDDEDRYLSFGASSQSSILDGILYFYEELVETGDSRSGTSGLTGTSKFKSDISICSDDFLTAKENSKRHKIVITYNDVVLSNVTLKQVVDYYYFLHSNTPDCPEIILEGKSCVTEDINFYHTDNSSLNNSSMDLFNKILAINSTNTSHNSTAKLITPVNNSGLNFLKKKFKNPYEIVITGAAFRALHIYFPNSLEPLSRVTKIFARMKPFDKKYIVTELMKPNSYTKSYVKNFYIDHSSDDELYIKKKESKSILDNFRFRTPKPQETKVLFCGDGANDMEALNIATVGVSLCDSATTVAASVISHDQTPLSVIEVLKEGRNSLCTAYILINFNMLYSSIQFFMTCFLNNRGLKFGDYMYLVQDLFFGLLLGLSISTSPSSSKLSRILPPSSLFSSWILIKTILNLLLFPAFQSFILELLYYEGWYSPYEIDPEVGPLVETYAWEGTVINVLALFQLMIASVVATIGEPFRRPWYKNKYHVGLLIAQFGYILYIMFERTDNEFLIGIDHTIFPIEFGFVLILVGFCNMLVSAYTTKCIDFIFNVIY